MTRSINRAFTLKSFLAGLFISLLVAVVFEYNRVILQPAIVTSYLPAMGITLVCLFAFPWNAIMGRWVPALRFSKLELVVIFGMVIVTSWIPPLLSHGVPQTIIPQYKGANAPNWRDSKVLSYLPSEWLPGSDEAELDHTIHIGLLQGLGPQTTIQEVPFGAWLSSSLHWGALFLLFIGAVVSLSLIVHKQWAHHEQLSYPLASVADAFLQQDDQRKFSGIFSKPLFWFGFIPVFLAFFLNYLGLWFPETLPEVEFDYKFKWETIFPIVTKSGFYSINWVNISFLFIGIAYFIPSDVSLSVGLTPVIAVLITSQFYLATGTPVAWNDLSVFRAGGYLGFFIIIAFTGRHYYFPIFRKALGFGPKLNNDDGAVGAARVFLLAYFGLIFLLWAMGLNLFISFAFISLLLTM